MKKVQIKGSSGAVTIKKTGIFCLIICAVLLALRFYQMSYLTETDSGFFTDKSNPTVMLFYILSVGFAVLTVLFCYITKKLPDTEISDKRDLTLGFASVLFAASIVYESISSLKEIMEVATVNGTNLIKASKIMGNYYYFIFVVVGFLSAAFFVAAGISFISGKMFIKKMKFCALIPVFWSFILTINYFTITVSYLKVAQLMITIFADAFLMLFLFQFARTLSGIGRLDAMWAYYATALPAAVLLFVSSIPTLVFTVADKADLIVDNCDFKAYNLVGGFFVLAALMAVIKNKPVSQLRTIPVEEFPAEDDDSAENTAGESAEKE